MGGGISSLYSIESFVPNEGIPGQSQSVVDLASALSINKRDLDKLYSAYIRLQTEGVTFKLVLNYVLIAIGIEATPFSTAVFKLWDEKQADANYINFEEFVEFAWSFLSLDDVMIPMLVFHLFDVGERGYLEHEDIKFMVSCLYGPVPAERNNDIRIALGRIKGIGEEKINPELFINLTLSCPALLFPVFELKKAMTTAACGLKFWNKYRDRRSQKVFDKFEKQNFEFSDFYLDEECQVRYFLLTTVDMPERMKARFNNILARRQAELTIENESEQEKKKKKKKLRKLDPYEQDVLKIMAPLPNRLTATFENITGNKFARALAFGKNYEQTRNHHGRVVLDENKKERGKGKRDRHQHDTDDPDASKGKDKDKDKDKDAHSHHHEGDSNNLTKTGEDGGASKATEGDGDMLDGDPNNRKHNQHHTDKGHSSHAQQASTGDAAAAATAPERGVKGMVKRLTISLGMQPKVKAPRPPRPAASGQCADPSEDAVKVAAKTKNNRFGDLQVKAAVKEKPKAKRVVQAAGAGDDFLMDDIGEDRPEGRPPAGSGSGSGGRKSIVQRISFAFYNVKTKAGYSKPKKYKIAHDE